MLSIVIATYNKASLLLSCIDKVYRYTADFELIVVDNSSIDNTLIMLKSYLGRDNFKYIRLDRNYGFGLASNIGARVSCGEYICTLNNDVMVAPQWAEILINELKSNPQLGQIGCNKIANYLGLDGNGHWKEGINAEYIEGSLMIIPRTFYEEGGLFDEQYKYGYCEDSDFSLRLRCRGHQIKSIDIPGVVHLHKQTSSMPELRAILDSSREDNCRIFLKRWGKYLRQKQLGRTILIKRGAANGDVLLLAPVIEAIKTNEPDSIIDIQTECPEVLKNNPHIRNVYRYHQNVNNTIYDNVYDLDSAYEKNPLLHTVIAYAQICEVDVVDTRAKMYFSEDSKIYLPEDSRPTVCVDYGRSWPCRVWEPHMYRDLVKSLHKKGYRVISVGKNGVEHSGEDIRYVDNTTMHQAGFIIGQSDVFIGHDGLMAHIAQATYRKSIIMYGCTKPYYRQVLNDPNVVSISCDIPCQGCHHILPAPRYHTDCQFGTNACIKGITVNDVVEKLEDLCPRGEKH